MIRLGGRGRGNHLSIHVLEKWSKIVQFKGAQKFGIARVLWYRSITYVNIRILAI